MNKRCLKYSNEISKSVGCGMMASSVIASKAKQGGGRSTGLCEEEAS